MTSAEISQALLAARFARVADHVNANARLVQRARTLCASVIVVIGSERFLLRIAQGRIVELTSSFPLFHPCDLYIQGSLRAWKMLWEPTPAPGWHDIFALHKKAEMVIEGTSQTFFAHLQYLKEVLEMPRHFGAQA